MGEEEVGWGKEELLKSGPRGGAHLWIGFASRMKHCPSLIAPFLQSSVRGN